MTLEELQKALQEGRAVTKDNGETYLKIENGLFVVRDGKTGHYYTPPFITVGPDCFLKDETGYKLFYKDSILTESEKKYLSDVIRPFKGKYEITIKKINYVGDDKAFICIELLNNAQAETVCLPYFDFNEMYKGMESFKAYSLEELGL